MLVYALKDFYKINHFRPNIIAITDLEEFYKMNEGVPQESALVPSPFVLPFYYDQILNSNL